MNNAQLGLDIIFPNYSLFLATPDEKGFSHDIHSGVIVQSCFSESTGIYTCLKGLADLEFCLQCPCRFVFRST